MSHRFLIVLTSKKAPKIVGKYLLAERFWKIKRMTIGLVNKQRKALWNWRSELFKKESTITIIICKNNHTNYNNNKKKLLYIYNRNKRTLDMCWVMLLDNITCWTCIKLCKSRNILENDNNNHNKGNNYQAKVNPLKSRTLNVKVEIRSSLQGKNQQGMWLLLLLPRKSSRIRMMKHTTNKSWN